MQRFFFLLLLLLVPFFSNAAPASVKIKKVKGQMALMEFQGKLKPGESYLLVPADNTAEDFKTGPRLHRLGASFNFNSLKTKTSSVEYNPSDFSLSFDYGWNHETYEVGPTLSYSSNSTGFGGATSTITAGFFYDYNFTENKEPVSYLFGTGLKVSYSNIAPASGATGLYTINFYPNFFWKWWAFGHSTAFKMDAGYLLQSGKDSSSSSFTTSGIASTASLLFYY